jgi:hypothetical protein
MRAVSQSLAPRCNSTPLFGESLGPRAVPPPACGRGTVQQAHGPARPSRGGILTTSDGKLAGLVRRRDVGLG